MKEKKWGRSQDPMKGWPQTEEGTPVSPVLLCSFAGKPRDYEVTVNLLNAYGVPVMIDYPGDGSFGKVVLGVSGYGAQLYVPETMLPLAKDLISDQAEFSEEEA